MTIERYFRYTDNDSDKYWEIQYSETTLTVFFGKIGSTGRVDEKQFPSAAACQKEALSLIASKIKKGYTEIKKSSRLIQDAEALQDIQAFQDEWDFKVHPIAKKIMNEAFFWSSMEETSPFGSDEGADTFAELKDAYEDNPRMKILDFLKSKMQDTTLYPLRDLACVDEHTLASGITGKSLDYLVIQDSAIWAMAFGQLVLKGTVDPTLKIVAEKSFARQKLALLLKVHNDKNRVKHIEKMEAALLRS